MPAATAEAAETILQNPQVVMGTVGYMSPEQIRGQTVDSLLVLEEQSDLWLATIP